MTSETARRITRELAAIVKVDKFRAILCVLNNSTNQILSHVTKLTIIIAEDIIEFLRDEMENARFRRGGGLIN